MADDQRHDIAELYTKVTLGDLMRSFTHFNWLSFFETMFRDIRTPSGHPVVFDSNTEVVVYGMEFLQRLDQLLPKYEPRSVTCLNSICNRLQDHNQLLVLVLVLQGDATRLAGSICSDHFQVLSNAKQLVAVQAANVWI